MNVWRRGAARRRGRRGALVPLHASRVPEWAEAATSDSGSLDQLPTPLQNVGRSRAAVAVCETRKAGDRGGVRPARWRVVRPAIARSGAVSGVAAAGRRLCQGWRRR